MFWSQGTFHFEFTDSVHRQPARWLSSTRLKIGRLIFPGQPALKNRPITGRFHFLIPWRLPFKIIKFPMPETELVYKRHFSNKRMKLDQGTGFVPGPLMFSSHEVTFPKQGLEQLTKCQLSRSQTAKQPDQNEELIRPQGDPDNTHWARQQTRHVLGLLF